MPDELYDIPKAADELGLSEGYIRLKIREGVIATVKVPVREGSTVTKHMIRKSELYAFSSRDGAKAPRRNDGRLKHAFYATKDEAYRVKELLYATHDPALMVVAESIIIKENLNGRHVPPSHRGPILEQPHPED